MNNYKTVFLIFFFSVFNIATSLAQFQGQPGFFILGQVGIPFPVSNYSKPFVEGATIRIKWQTIEPSYGLFDWNFLDSEIANAQSAGKKISLAIIGKPDWLENAGVPMYDYVDNYPASQTYGDTLQSPITWSDQYVSKLSGMIQALGVKYANNSTISYINAVSGRMNNNLPSEVADGTNFWVATNYHRDTLVSKMNQVLDVYMSAFPNTPSWNSLENVMFEMAASGNPNNYVITQFSNYGEITYPDRFGVWREDLHGCVVYGPSFPNTHWTTISNYGCRNGAQMVWNVQDGPQRMNNCGISPIDFSVSSKRAVLDSAISTGLKMDMHYFELYQTDVNDLDLDSLLTQKSLELQANWQLNCSNALSIENVKNIINVYPNPFKNHITIKGELSDFEITILNELGQIVYKAEQQQSPSHINLAHLCPGLYFIKLSNSNNVYLKMIKY